MTKGVTAVGLASVIGVGGCFGEAPVVGSPGSMESMGSMGDGGLMTGPLGTTMSTGAGTDSSSAGVQTPPGTDTTTDAADGSTTSAAASEGTGTGTTETAPAECGNDMAEPGEECDGADWRDATCETLGYAPGRLACSDACTFELSACVPPLMVLVPGGSFEMGSDDAAEEQPIRMVEVEPFYIDLYEVTVADYTQCVAAGTCRVPDPGVNCNFAVLGRENHPINCIDWFEAQTYCSWADEGVKRLPTEAEWEKAARGTDARTYPWGDVPLPSCTHAVMNEGDGQGCAEGSTSPVGGRPLGASANGALDMAGNVWEWVSDWYGPGYDPMDTVDPAGPNVGTLRVLRGGGWFHDTPADFTTTHRHEVDPDLGDPYIGVRCARSLPGAP